MAAQGDAARIAMREDRPAAFCACAGLGLAGVMRQATAPTHRLCWRWAQVQPRSDLAAAHPLWVREVLQAFDRFRLLCAVREGAWAWQGSTRRCVSYAARTRRDCR